MVCIFPMMFSPALLIFFAAFSELQIYAGLFSILRGFATANLRNIATALCLGGGFYF